MHTFTIELPEETIDKLCLTSRDKIQSALMALVDGEWKGKVGTMTLHCLMPYETSELSRQMLPQNPPQDRSAEGTLMPLAGEQTATAPPLATEDKLRPPFGSKEWLQSYIDEGKMPPRDRNITDFVHPTGRTAEEVDAYLEEMREERVRW